MPTRNINLTPELSELIDAEVASGRYQNASEVVRAGLRLLERSREEQVVRLQALHRVLDAAIVQADAALADKATAACRSRGRFAPRRDCAASPNGLRGRAALWGRRRARGSRRRGLGPRQCSAAAGP